MGLILIAGVAWLIWYTLSLREHGDAQALPFIVISAVVGAAIGLALGFTWAITFAASSNIAPIVGIIYTGPIGGILGGIAAARWHRRHRAQQNTVAASNASPPTPAVPRTPSPILPSTLPSRIWQRLRDEAKTRSIVMVCAIVALSLAQTAWLKFAAPGPYAWSVSGGKHHPRVQYSVDGLGTVGAWICELGMWLCAIVLVGSLIQWAWQKAVRR